jgi:hypothetical protein
VAAATFRTSAVAVTLVASEDKITHWSMPMTYRGHVRNGVIVLDAPASLPEGAEVEVIPSKDGTAMLTLAERYKDFIGIIEGLPPDLAENHDHYIHGAAISSRPVSLLS